MKNKYLSLLFCFFGLSFFTGCGHELKLSVKAAEVEKDQPSTALVRNVQLTYHDGQGKEQLRQSVPVLGLSQPVSIKSDLLKDLEWNKDGTFEANGYSGEGLLLIRGTAKPDPEHEDVVEIEMNRAQSQASVLASPLLRQVRFAYAPGLAEYRLDASEIRKATDKHQCVVLPPVKLDRSSAQVPTLIFGAAVKAPSFKIESQKGLINIPINPAGDAAFELKEIGNLKLNLYSSGYEGCLEVEINPVIVPLQANFGAGKGLGVSTRNQAWYNLDEVGILHITNPNEVSVTVQILVVASNMDGFSLCTLPNRTQKLFNNFVCESSFRQASAMPAHSEIKVHVFGLKGLDPKGNVMFLTSGFNIHWAVEVENLPTQSGSYDIR